MKMFKIPAAGRSLLVAGASLVALAVGATGAHATTPTRMAGTWLAVYDGGVVSAIVQWTEDGRSSQMLNFPPSTGNQLLGDWTIRQDGTAAVSLRGWTYDDSGALNGYFTKTELDRVNGATYNGRFDVNFYDLQGNLIFSHQGTLTAARIARPR